MKEYRPNSRALAKVRLLMIVIVILIGAFASVTAFMKGRSREQAKAGSVATSDKRANDMKPARAKDSTSGQQPSKPQPDVVQMVGPVSQDQDLRDLPYIPPTPREEEVRLTRHPFPLLAKAAGLPQLFAQTLEAPSLTMPAPSNTFEGVDSNASGCGCLPPDTDGDVGSNNYVQSVNSSIRVHDKSGNILAGPVSYNAFFSAMGTSTPCGNNQNDGDGIVFYDHMADRWVVSDFAFPAFPGTSFYQCIGVSKTSNPVSGGYWLYAVQVDPANNNYLGDYPKFGLWPDGYYLSMNEFSDNTTFNGVRVYALDRNSMVNGGSSNAIGFSILLADLGDQYSLVPASFRTGSAPPAGQPAWFMDINSSAAAGTVENQVFVRRFHADFVTPANSTFGVGGTHTPDGIITVNGFVDAFTSATGNIAPNGTATTTQWLDTLGDKLMYPLIYQNLGGAESIYAVHTTAPSNNGTTNSGPTAVTWYQFNMTGNSIPATPAQQQDWLNGNDGLFRWMPSINVDKQGNMAIGYSTSSSTLNPGIRWAGRLATDPANNLSQGEAVMTASTGHQTNNPGRWGDYSTMFVDPSDSCTFYHTNEYYSVTSGAGWRTRVGSFKFATCTASPIPTPTPTPTPTPVPTPTPPVSAGPVTVTATAGTVGPTDYATLQLAFAAINGGTHQGAINVFIVGDTTETASAVLNASGVGSASYTSILMTPVGARTVSGAIAAGSPLLDLNGAKNMTIDGLNTGGNSLTISNTTVSATAGTSTIRFISTTAAAGGAQNNTVKNCSILGSSTVAEGTAGGNILFSTTTANGTNVVGNNNNVISGNNIGPAGSNLPLKEISALGTAGNNTVNTGNVIDNNNIFDFFSATANTTGIDIRAGNQNWTISNNRIYQTATRTFTSTALRYAGITFSGTTGTNGNFLTITGNVIGFGAANGTGTTTITGSSNEVRGIDLQGASSSAATSVQGNIISSINQTSSRSSITTGLASFAGIQAATSAGAAATGAFDIGTVNGNTIGSLDGSSTIVINATSTTANTTPVFGILALSTSSNNVSNNKIGAITIQSTGTVTGFRGIFPGTTAATTQIISNNIIGGTGSGAITDTQSGSYALYGIQTSTAACVITGNLIRNIAGNANVSGSVNESGIAFTSTSTSAVSIISRNTVFNLTNSSGSVATNIYGMDLTMSTTAAVNGNLVERNYVHSLNVISTDATSQIYGMIIRGGNTTGTATTTVQNNMIRLGLDASGNPITTGFLIRGIRDSAAGAGGNTNNSYYFNSVYIGGTGVASSSNSQAFFSDQVTSATSPRDIRDNIFWNARSNAAGTGKNYAIAVGGTAPNPAGLTSNYNDLYATGTGGFVGLFNSVDQTTLANWQAATGQDANSISADPLFVNPTGTSSTVDLHIQSGSPAISAATSITTTTASPLTGITNDFDNDPRPAISPDIGADQLFQTVGGTIAAGTYYDLTVNNGDTLGGDVTVTHTLYLNGKLSTGSFTLTLDCDATVVGAGASSYVIGKLARNFCAAGAKTFDVGTANGYSPIDVNVTAGTFTTSFTVKAIQGPQPNFASPQYALQRYWTLTATGVTADLTFHYLDPTDIPGTANENNFVIFKYDGSFTMPGGSVNPGANTASISGVTSFSDWTLAQPNSPTAAPATIGGQVITREGRPLGGVTVNLSGNRAARTITDGNGMYRFENVDTDAFYSVAPALANYSFNPPSRSFTLLANKPDAVFTATRDSIATTNAIDTNEYFVRQQYLDFLGREPDQGGFEYWTDRLNQCGGDPDCLRQRRIDVSAAFFASEEFQETGSFIYRLYQGALGRQLSYAEFSADRQQVIGGPNLDASKAAFANAFVERTEFAQKYQASTTAESFVDALLQTVASSGADLSSERDNLIASYHSGGSMKESRSLVLRALANNAALSSAVYNPSFVLMEYFGYLRRDSDLGGYDFWLNVLNNREAGNYRGMVCAFITSTEYQRRFGSVVTHTNAECQR
jgi:Domain of unknown function (DUF4214)